jgi:hypothetical protein
MRIVRWAPSERVDIPDITAMSFLTLGEFRRTLRALVTGDAPYVVQGFKVEPEAPATTRIRVRLQPPGEFKGAAIGGEQTAPGLDYGQLIGNRDSSFLDEGASQQFIDFVGQPNGPYTIEMRFTYTDGVNDNRAFWNAGTSTEFVAVTATRHVSGWQIQRVAAPSGGQWIPLATVTWDGVAVDAADITDTRVFLFEGTAPFSRTTQEGAGGVEDFSRTTTRGDDAVGRFRMREVVRGLMRQVQDLKGANDSGVWDWFSRVYRPWDPAGALNAQRTKSLRTIDTVTYTVGDGVTLFGDFNGATGLEQCLDHIEALADANRPERIEIVVHGGTTGYTITSPKFLQPGSGDTLTVIIRGGVTNSQTNVGGDGRPRISIDGAGITAANFAIVSGNGGNLVLRDLDVVWTGTTAGGRGMFGAGGWLQAFNCRFLMTSPAVDAGNVLFSSLARKSRITNCEITGRVQFYDESDFVDRADRDQGGVMENCRLLSSHVRLSDVGVGIGPNVAVGFTIRNCTIEGRATAVYTSSVGLIDARCASYLLVENCTLNYGLNENGIDGRTFESDDIFHWTIRDTQFFTGVSNGAAHAPGAGQNGASGTGWAINVESTTNGALRVHVENCKWGVSSTDAGGVRFHNTEQCSIRGGDMIFCSHEAGGTDTFQGVQVTATAAGWKTQTKITDLMIGKWIDDLPRTRGIRLQNVDDVSIMGCTINGDQFDGTDIAARTTTDSAVWIDDCDDVRVIGNKFGHWNFGVATSACVYIPSSSVAQRFICTGNQFEGNGNYAIHFVGAAPPVGFIGPVIANNVIAGLGDSLNLGITLTSGAGGTWAVCDNVIRHNTGVGNDAIFFNNMGGGVCSGNDSNADIRKTGVTLIRGYKPDDDFLTLNQNLNNPNAYT